MFSRILKTILGFIIIITVQYLCNLLVKYLHIILPAPILGLIIFAFLLNFGIIKKEWVKDSCNLLLQLMPLMFVPIFVGIIAYYGIIEKNLIPILVNIIITATLTLLLTAIVVDNIIKFIRLRHIRKLKND